MGNYEQLKEAIRNVIKQNGRQEITGQILQSTLLSIVSSVGENASFAGVAIPSTVPATSDKNIFYIAGKKGTYANFGGKVVSSEAVIFTNRSGSWVSINTGLATLDGVTTSIQSEHAFIEEGLDRLDRELTELKQTDITDMKGDIELNSSEIQKAQNNITKINGEIATLNEASNTAADELVRIEGKVDANLKDAVVVFLPSTNTGLLKDADILGFTNETAAGAVNTYMQQYWEKLVAVASGEVAGRVYAEANDANCTGSSCISGKKFVYTEINVLSYGKGTGISATDETLKISFERSDTYTEMTFSQKSGRISVTVISGKNIVATNDFLVDCSNSDFISGSYWNGEAKLVKWDSYFAISVNVIGISKIFVRTAIYDNAKVLLVGRDGSVLSTYTVFENKSIGYVLDLSYYKSTAYKLLISCYADSADIFKAVVTEFYEDYNNIIRGAAADVHTLDILAYENAGGFNIDGSANHNLPGLYKRVYACKSVKSFLVNSVMDNEKVASIVGLSTKDAQSGEVIERGVVDGERIVSIPEKYSYVAITFKSIKRFSIFEPRGSVYTLLSELMKDKGTLSLLGDGLSSRNNIAYYKLNSGEIKGAGEYIAERYKLNVSNENYDFATLTDCKTKAAPDLNCVLTDDAIISMGDKKPNYILIWYGINDVTYGPIMQRELWLKDKYGTGLAYPMQESEIGKEGYATAEQKAEVDKAVGRVGEVDYDNADSYFFAKFVGTENDEELTTWCGALNYAFPLLMSEYPEAKIMIICPDHEQHGKLIREATIKMAEKWGVLYFDLNSLPYWYGSEKTKFENTQHEEMSWLLASGETAAPTVEGFNKSRYSYDGVRPSDLGHKVISFPIGNKLING